MNIPHIKYCVILIGDVRKWSTEVTGRVSWREATVSNQTRTVRYWETRKQKKQAISSRLCECV